MDSERTGVCISVILANDIGTLAGDENNLKATDSLLFSINQTREFLPALIELT